MESETTALEACDLGWSITMIGRGYAAVIDPVFADFPRGARGYQLLHTVIHESIRSQTALADYLGVDRTVMPYVVDDLETAGLVARRDSPTDRRLRIVVATDEGKERYAALSEAVRLAEQDFFGDLSDARRAAFVDTLATMAHRSRELGSRSRR